MSTGLHCCAAAALTALVLPLSPIEADIIRVDASSACAYLATPFAARLTGATLYVDGGIHIMA